jgi:SAM-dependent methyltransferase
MDEYKNYWQRHWQSHDKLDEKNSQKQVARTKFGLPISENDWIKTCEYVVAQLQPQPTDSLLDLCCGNGLLTAYLINYVDHIVAVDYSRKLLDAFVIENDRVAKVLSDALTFDYESYRFNRAVMYFSAQHFSERSLISVVRKIHRSLEDGGTLLLGDIPDIHRKWDYFHKIEYRNFYFSNLESGRPAVGTWYDRIYFEYLAEYLGFRHVEIQDQPNFMINSNHRFDVLLVK